MVDFKAINEEIAKLLKEGKYVQAIKVYREKAGVSLKDAKEYVDLFAKKLNLSHTVESFESTRVPKKTLMIFAILNIILIIGFIICINIVSSLEYMESLFGYTEWQVDQLNSILVQQIYLIPLVIGLEIFLFAYLINQSIGQRRVSKGFGIFICILLIITMSISYFLKLDKNRFKDEAQMKKIFSELRGKNIFKNEEIEVSGLNFFVGDIDRQTSIYIIGEFNYKSYIYRPYNLITNWKRSNFRTNGIEKIKLDDLNIETIVPKVFKATEDIIKDKSYRFKGISGLSLRYTTVNDKEDWYWKIDIRERGEIHRNTEHISFDLEGNIVELPSVFGIIEKL